MTLRQSFAAATLALCAVAVVPAFGQRTTQTPSSTNNNNNSASATAGKAVVKAQADVNQIQADINKIRNKVRNELLAKPEWAAVVAAKKKAETTLESTKKAALVGVHNKPEYKQLMEERETARKQLETANTGSSSITDEDLQKASGIMVKDGLAMKQMENAALNDDPKYADAKQQYDAANAKMSDLDAQVDQALKDQPDYAQKTQALEQAKQQLEQARTQLKTARQAEEQQREQQLKAKQQQRSGSRRG